MPVSYPVVAGCAGTAVTLAQPAGQSQAFGINVSYRRSRRTWKASPEPDYEAKAARVLELTPNPPPGGGVVIAFGQMGPVSPRPTAGHGWAPKRRPKRQRADYNRRHGDALRVRGLRRFTPTGCAHACGHATGALTTRVHDPDPRLLPRRRRDLLDPRQPSVKLDTRHPQIRDR